MCRVVRQCHRCPHDGMQSRACLKCDMPQLSNHGACHISIDALNESSEELIDNSSASNEHQERPFNLPADHSSALLKQWAKDRGLTERQTEVVLSWVIPGSTKSSVAKRVGVSVSRVHQVLKGIAGKDARLLKAFSIKER